MKSVSPKVINERADKDVTVMIVDDSKVIRLALNKILKKDFNVIQAQDGEDAWEKLSAHSEIAAIFSDVSMPNLDGFGLLERVRQSSTEVANLPFIIITGNDDDPGFANKVTEHGGDALITKPFNTSEITDCIEKYISIDNAVEENEPFNDLASESDFAKILGFDSPPENNLDVVDSELENSSVPNVNTEIDRTESDPTPLDFEFTISEDFLNDSKDTVQEYKEDTSGDVAEISNDLENDPINHDDFKNAVNIPEIDLSLIEPTGFTEPAQQEKPLELEIDFGEIPDALPLKPETSELKASNNSKTNLKLEIEQARKRAIDIARDKAAEDDQNQQIEDSMRASETLEIRERLKALRERESKSSEKNSGLGTLGQKITLILGGLKRIIVKLMFFRK